MSEAHSDIKVRLYLWLILVLGSVLRLIGLGSQSFWWDEVYSVTLSTKSLGTVISRFGQTPALYHTLLHFWLNLGRGDALIRLFSVIFGVAAIWLVYLLGKSVLDARHGLMVAFLLAINPFHIW